MSRKMKFIIIAGLVVLLLTFGIGVSAIAADDATPTTTPPAAVVKQEGIIARVAEILNISSANLTQAMRQADKELKDTKPTADAYFAKVAEILKIDKATLVAAVQQATKDILNLKMDALLDKAVAKGTITADEKAQIDTWFDQRPSAFDKLFNFGAFNAFKGWGKAHGFFGKNVPQPKVQPGKPVKPPKITPKPIPLPTPTVNATSIRMY